MSENVTARCNWQQLAGKELSQLVATRLSEEDVFVKPNLDDVVDECRAVLLTNINTGPTVACELQFQISKRFKIAALTLVCSVPKMELFLGPSQEYLETIYGIALEEDEDEKDAPIRSYRYDVEIDRSGVADITLKLLTSSEEICIFGSMLHIAPNPNGITTQQQKPFDLQKIQELLHRGGSAQAKPEENEQKLQKFMTLMQGFTGQQAPARDIDSDIDKNSINQFIQSKFVELERTISKRLDEFEAKQAAKLDQIITMLEKRSETIES